MLIAFQKSSQNRKATQNGGVFSLEKKRGFTIHWPARNFKEQAFFHSCSFLCFVCISEIATVLYSFVSPTFWHTGLLSNRIQTILFRLPPFLSALLFITAKQGHAQHTHPRYSRCGRAPLSSLCSAGKLNARWQDWGGSKSPNRTWLS